MLCLDWQLQAPSMNAMYGTCECGEIAEGEGVEEGRGGRRGWDGDGLIHVQHVLFYSSCNCTLPCKVCLFWPHCTLLLIMRLQKWRTQLSHGAFCQHGGIHSSHAQYSLKLSSQNALSRVVAHQLIGFQGIEEPTSPFKEEQISGRLVCLQSR